MMCGGGAAGAGEVGGGGGGGKGIAMAVMWSNVLSTPVLVSNRHMMYVFPVSRLTVISRLANTTDCHAISAHVDALRLRAAPRGRHALSGAWVR